MGARQFHQRLWCPHQSTTRDLERERRRKLSRIRWMANKVIHKKKVRAFTRRRKPNRNRRGSHAVASSKYGLTPIKSRKKKPKDIGNKVRPPREGTESKTKTEVRSPKHKKHQDDRKSKKYNRRWLTGYKKKAGNHWKNHARKKFTTNPQRGGPEAGGKYSEKRNQWGERKLGL